MKSICFLLVYLYFSNFVIAQKVDSQKFKLDSLSEKNLALMEDILSNKDIDKSTISHEYLPYYQRKSIVVIPIPPATSKNSQLKLSPLYYNDRKFDFLHPRKDSLFLK